jgi:hypothetical protein
MFEYGERVYILTFGFGHVLRRAHAYDDCLYVSLDTAPGKEERMSKSMLVPAYDTFAGPREDYDTTNQKGRVYRTDRDRGLG